MFLARAWKSLSHDSKVVLEMGLSSPLSVSKSICSRPLKTAANLSTSSSNGSVVILGSLEVLLLLSAVVDVIFCDLSPSNRIFK